MPKIVLCYSRKDKNIAIDMVNKLQKENLEIWFDGLIKPGENFVNEINKALVQCHMLILLWSKSASKSPIVRYEWTSALASEKCIIPCIIDNENLPTILNSTQFIDFVDVGFECGYNYLVKSLKNTKNVQLDN